MSKRQTQNSVYAVKGDPKSGQFVLDGTVQNAETFIKRFLDEAPASQGNGFDAYVGQNGPSRSDTISKIPSQGLGKIGLLLIDALHANVGEGDADAEKALNALRGYDAVAAQRVADRKAANAKEKLRQAALDAGIPVDKVNAFLGIEEPAPVAVPPATVEEAPEVVNGDGNADADEAPVAEEQTVA